ncbi:LIC_13387 family protein [Aeromonas bivalvium]|uniref:LIC_13387 family protein n=1 Tax=Aeromonas bivalvium TaxID=440079 RepID=UPI0038D1C8E3
MITKYLYIAGCIPFLVLGILHTAYTITDIFTPKKLIPYQSDVMGLMKSSSLAITKETNMWRAWVGFNISHGIGMLFFSVTYLYLSTFYTSLLESSVFFMSAAPIISSLYLALSKKYWFRIPTIGSTIGLLCFVAGALAQLYR